MRGFLRSQLRTRSGRALAFAAVLVAASVATVLLISSARTQALRVRGTVRTNYRAAYDILVRPAGSRTALERREGLVRDNYLSGLFGGITLRELREVRSIRYVDVAAPIANIGWVLFIGQARVPLDDLVTDEPFQLYRLRGTYLEEDGTSRYPSSEVAYIYYTTLPLSRNPYVTQRCRGRSYRPCDGIYK